eukprot:TRINITY_DN4916_c0_g2_i1.p1 TRINITY_DN4916_c0_g2~~TRINITY_DN4916_c0_g2_i1.p1  ORF type:complete len:354 (-),score=76.35 TRINITY_DN4916_c0_g2_i1:139-1071(-)
MEYDDGEWRGPSPSAPPPPPHPHPPHSTPLPHHHDEAPATHYIPHYTPLPEQPPQYYYTEAEDQFPGAYGHGPEVEPLRREPLVPPRGGSGRFLVDLNIPANHFGILEHSIRPWSAIIALVVLIVLCLFTGAVCLHCVLSDDPPPEEPKHEYKASSGGDGHDVPKHNNVVDDDDDGGDNGCTGGGASCFFSFFVACVALFVAYNARQVVFQFNDHERHILVQEKRIIRRLCDPCGFLGMASRPSSLREFRYDNVAGFGVVLKPMRRENHERLADVTINMHSGESVVLMTSTLTNANHFCDELITYWQYRV